MRSVYPADPTFFSKGRIHPSNIHPILFENCLGERHFHSKFPEKSQIQLRQQHQNGPDPDLTQIPSSSPRPPTPSIPANPSPHNLRNHTFLSLPPNPSLSSPSRLAALRYTHLATLRCVSLSSHGCSGSRSNDPSQALVRPCFHSSTTLAHMPEPHWYGTPKKKARGVCLDVLCDSSRRRRP